MDCKLHTLPERRPPIWVSAFGLQAAEVAGRWGDAVWTLPDPESTAEVLAAFREARARAGREVVVLQNNSGDDPLGAIRVYGERVPPALRNARVGSS